MTVVYYGTKRLEEAAVIGKVEGYFLSNLEAMLGGVTGGYDTKITFKSFIPGPIGAASAAYTFFKNENDQLVG